MFSERLNSVLELLQMTPAEFARSAHIDKSYISRMLSGQKVPKKGGDGLKHLAKKILDAADEKKMRETLFLLIGSAAHAESEDDQAKLMAWLLQGGEEDTEDSSRQDAENARIFGKRLSALMELVGLSNVHLGRSLNIDPSYVSRFRNGLRYPGANPKLMDELTALILERLTDQGKTALLSRLSGIPPERLTEPEEAFGSLYDWLFCKSRPEPEAYIESLIQEVGELSEMQVPMSDALSGEDMGASEEDKAVYYGLPGLREAVLRFLRGALRREEKELFLYSDQNMDWMVRDTRYGQQWAGLMRLCISRGTRIVIVHHLRRTPDEMTEAIKDWLPLYATGLIQSYYSTRKKGERFSTTVFLCPGYACIHGSNAAGTENETGIYHYETAPELLAAERMNFDALLKDSKALVKLYRTDQEGFMVPQETGRSGSEEEVGSACREDRKSAELSVRRPEEGHRNVQILISDHAVALRQLKEPYFTVFSEHPALYKAFSEYIGKLKKERNQEEEPNDSEPRQ